MMKVSYIKTEYLTVPLTDIQPGEMFTVPSTTEGVMYMMPKLRQKLPGGLMSVVCMDGYNQAMLAEAKHVHRVLEVRFEVKQTVKQ